MKALEDNKKYWAKFAQEDRMCAIDQSFFENLTKDIFLTFKNKKVLDFGCGTGRVYHLFKESNYFGVDISPEVLSLFKEKYPDARFCLTEEFDEKDLDIIWCWSIFTHYPLEDIKELLEYMLNVMKKDGKIYFSYIESSNPEEDFQDVGFFTHRIENIKKILNELNLNFQILGIVFPPEGMNLRQKLVEVWK